MQRLWKSLGFPDHVFVYLNSKTILNHLSFRWNSSTYCENYFRSSPNRFLLIPVWQPHCKRGGVFMQQDADELFSSLLEALRTLPPISGAKVSKVLTIFSSPHSSRKERMPLSSSFLAKWYLYFASIFHMSRKRRSFVSRVMKRSLWLVNRLLTSCSATSLQRQTFWRTVWRLYSLDRLRFILIN